MLDKQRWRCPKRTSHPHQEVRFAGIFRIRFPPLFPPGYGEENCPSLAGAAIFEENPSTIVAERKDGPSRTTSGSGFLSEEENNLSDPAEETAGTVALFPAKRR